METRHYVTMGVAVIVLQLLLWLFLRRVNWLLNLSGASAWALNGLIFIGLNALVFSAPLRLFEDSFRVAALVLTLLLYLAFASLAVSALQLLLKNTFVLKISYLAIFIGLVGLSLYNAYTPVVRHFSVQLDKKMETLRIGVASDFHLGKLFGGAQLDKLAQIMDAQKVDVILLPGDIMDDNVNAFLEENMSTYLAKLRAPLGVYATLGNHDFLGDQQRIEQAIRQAGIVPLLDQRLQVANRLEIIGRNDDLVVDRPTAAQLLQGADLALPVLLMDHRPSDIEIHAQLPIDIQVSGHTHNGQVFPANFVVKMLYRLAYGYEEINQSHFFVTSGYGFWGVPFRLGSQAEVLIIDVKGRE